MQPTDHSSGGRRGCMIGGKGELRRNNKISDPERQCCSAYRGRAARYGPARAEVRKGAAVGAARATSLLGCRELVDNAEALVHGLKSLGKPEDALRQSYHCKTL